MRTLTFLLPLLVSLISLQAEEPPKKDPRQIKLDEERQTRKESIVSKEKQISDILEQKRSSNVQDLNDAFKVLNEANGKLDSAQRVVDMWIKQRDDAIEALEKIEKPEPGEAHSAKISKEKTKHETNRDDAIRELPTAESTLRTAGKEQKDAQDTYNKKQDRSSGNNSALSEEQIRRELASDYEELENMPRSISALDPLPLADWINVTQIKSFLNPIFQSVTNQENYFNTIDSLNQYYLDLQPYGFNSSFSLGKDSFKLQTFGISIQGGGRVKGNWLVGGGIGYWHSHLDYKAFFRGEHYPQDGSINSFYFGPFAAYLFEKGYIQLRALGIYNSYTVYKESSQGWDLDAELEGGFNFEIQKYVGPYFFIQPNIKLDYLMVFQDENPSINSVKVDQANFFSSRLAVQFFKEFPQGSSGVIIPSVSIGWVLMHPLSQNAICHDRFESIDYKSSNQAYLEAKLSGIHKKGILMSLGFEAYLGDLYPVYAYNLKLGFEW
jgi:hypothetical protein